MSKDYVEACHKCRGFKSINPDEQLSSQLRICVCPTILDKILGSLIMIPFYCIGALASLLSTSSKD